MHLQPVITNMWGVHSFPLCPWNSWSANFTFVCTYKTDMIMCISQTTEPRSISLVSYYVATHITEVCTYASDNM